jgi:hypothetical protein
MAVGRITGPLLKSNLLRNGVNLAFETNLLYLDVVNGRVGIKTASPAYDLDINGTTRTSNLTVTTQADLASFTISGNTISSTNSQINLTPNGASPVVYQGTIVTGNLQLSTNTIATTGTNTDLNITTTGTGVVNINSNMLVNGNLHATGNITADGGTITLGDTDTDNVVFAADINSNLIPNIDNTYTLGTDAKRWKNMYASAVVTTTVTVDNINIAGNTITTTNSNLNLNLQANGTGNVVFEGIQVSDNNISSTVTNADVILTPQGTGSVVVNSNQSMIIPVGTTSDRPASPTVGMVRYNTTLSRYEGWNGSYWLQLNGVQDVDGNTKITAELTPGANDNTIRFYANGSIPAYIDSSKLYAIDFKTDNLDITNNTISTINSNTDMIFSTSGTGGVRLGNFKINNNTIQNIVSGAITEITESGTGYVRLAGVNGVVIPSGNTTTDRPAVPEAGMMRFNTDYQSIEVYNGTAWTSAAGTLGGVTTADATDIAILAALTLG